jgi:hypothetical protein
MAHRDTQHAAANPSLHGDGRDCIEIDGGVEAQRAGSVEAEHPCSANIGSGTN